MAEWLIAIQLMLMLWALGDITKAINGLAKTVRDNSAGRGLRPPSLPTRQ